MPGVPSSRGCDACRQQKKKCDQLKPLCSRCARLRVPCIGSGQRRYKFLGHTTSLDQTLPHLAKQPSTTKDTEPTPPLPLATRLMPVATIPVAVPSNKATLDASRFVSALQVTDVRFDLRIYGPFFVDLPRRLGRNQALDASIRALSVSFPAVQTHKYTSDMYKAYGEALGCLRAAVGDATTAGSVETLCAVYLIVICQGWIGRGGDIFPSHGEAIAHLLNAAATSKNGNWQDEFAAELANTLLVIVLLESFTNHRINLNPVLWASELPLTIARPNREPHISNSPTGTDGVECLRIPALASISSYVRDVRGHLPGIRSTYYGPLQRDLARMKFLLSDRLSCNDTPTERHVHARRQTRYGMVLLLALMANWALSVYDTTSLRTTLGDGDAGGGGAELELEKEANYFVDETIHLAEEASVYRPLAASAMPAFILAARTMLGVKQHRAEDDGDRKRKLARLARIEELLVLYRGDFPASAAGT
ncbi:hypothetical protein B0H66DRAFT_568491 [Apodospora peruviana]|uniref:Zn(2)-C6 fungal-type domain-containing protein n=1 Tax=Apodospora peruviana TaxID=516989 RepID=A0AAE0HV96_9PEZI|nr:hypothetical protein B0H66DRAFT_568491 [Apodospora peruviana]